MPIRQKYYITHDQLQELRSANNGNDIFVLCEGIRRKQKLNTERKERLTKGLVNALLDFCVAYKGKPLHLQSVIKTKSAYNNFQKLKYHGLVTNTSTGYWDITETCNKFLSGKPVSTYVVVDDNQTIDYSPKKTTIHKILKTQKTYQQVDDYRSSYK